MSNRWRLACPECQSTNYTRRDGGVWCRHCEEWSAHLIDKKTEELVI